MPSITIAVHSAGGKLVEEGSDLAQDQRIAGCSIKRRTCQFDQGLGMERGGNALEPRCSDMPVPVAARPLHQVKLLARTIDKGLTKLLKQRVIPAGGERNRGIKRSGFKNHGAC